MNALLLTWPGNEPLGTSLGAALDAEPVAFSTRVFPDGETYLRIDTDVRGRAAVVLCALKDPDARFLALAGALRIVTTNSIAHPSNDIELGGLLAAALRHRIERAIHPET